MSAEPARARAAGPGALLSVRDLSVVFDTDEGPLVAVDGVSFDIAPGRTLGLVGESGCGKSMTALALLDLVPPPGRVEGGAVVFEGRDLRALSRREMARLRGDALSIVFQEPMTSLNPVYTVGDQIAEVFRIHRGTGLRESWAAAVDMLARVRIPDAARRARDYPHQLSGGMRQRAVIAMALACEPRLLIADEPTTALDVTIQAQILDLVAGLQAEMGMAVLFISHNLAVVAELADEVAVMYAGTIVEHAPMEDLFANPLHPYTRGLLATVPRPGERRERLPAIAGAVPDMRALPPGCRFSDRCPLADDECRRAEPALAPFPAGAAHRVACYKAGE